MELIEKKIGKDIKVCGVSCRTSNADGKAIEDMKLLWQRFFAEKIMERLENRSNDNIVSIYTDYEAGQSGLYTAIVGFEVTEYAELEGIECHTIPAGTYRMTDIQNPTSEKVSARWQEIWKRDPELARKFETDFEVYHTDKNGTPVCVEIFIG